LRSWTLRHWSAAAVGAVLAALLVGVPTGIIETPFYTRMTPVLWWNYPVWAVTAALSGLLVATYVATPRADTPEGGKAMTGGLLSLLAVGCPVCNKLVVAAVGVSGALTYWAPIQPVLALISVGLLAYALRRRLRTQAACPVVT
jgi:hypothetical protein